MDDCPDAARGDGNGAIDRCRFLWPIQEIETQMRYHVGAVEWANGPHSRSNWLPVGPRRGPLQLCVGNWPFQLPSGYGFGEENETVTLTKVSRLLEDGVTTFVNLTMADEWLISSPECTYNHWAPKVEDLAAEIYGDAKIQVASGKQLRFDIACPMRDEGVAPDDDLAKLLSALIAELEDRNRVLYVHCFGGHGRTGVACCSLLCLLYPGLGRLPEELRKPWATESIRNHVSVNHIQEMMRKHPAEYPLAEGAVAVFNRFHAERDCEQGGGRSRFPHSPAQLAQVVRVAAGAGPFASLPRFGTMAGEPTPQGEPA